MEALAEVAPEKDLRALSALEYCTMCIYYDSQTYPSAWTDRVAARKEESQTDRSNEGYEVSCSTSATGNPRLSGSLLDVVEALANE